MPYSDVCTFNSLDPDGSDEYILGVGFASGFSQNPNIEYSARYGTRIFAEYRIYMLVFSILFLCASSGLLSADIVTTCLLHGKYYTVMALVVIQYIL